MSGPRLADVALLGTSRQSAEAPLPEPLRAVAAALPEDLDSGRRLLLLAGLDAVYRAAGYLPGSHALEVPPEDTRPAPPEKAEGVLAEILAQGHRPLLHWTLEHLDRAGLRWPAAHLPPLLEQGRSVFRGRLDLLGRLLDRRGAWLASQHADWAWALTLGATKDPNPTTAWQEGDIETRVRAFASLRQADPGAARDALAAVFKQDKAEARAALLACLRDGIAPADESFLESCLKDRSQLVREVAKELLLLLPESAWARRCRERVFALLRRSAPAAGGGLLGGLKKILGGAAEVPTLVELPEEADKAWEEDGIVLKAPQGIGAKAFWLAQLVATVSPRLLAEHLGLEPAALVETFARHEWNEPLLVGFARSTAYVGDRELAMLVLSVLAKPPAKMGVLFYENTRELSPRLFSCLTAEERLRLCTQWLEKGVPPGIEIREGLLPETFTFEAARAFLERLKPAIEAFRRSNEFHLPFAPMMLLAATALPLELGPDLDLPVLEVENNDRVKYYYEPARKKFQEIIHLRQRLAQEIPL